MNVILPPKGKDLVEAVKSLVDEAERLRKVRSVTWWTVYWYLQGARNFEELNYRDGIVRVSYPNARGIDFVYEEIVTRLRTEVGQLLRIDTSPKVDRRGLTLDSLRKVSVGQMVLDSLFTKARIEQVKQSMVQLLVQYGMVGISVWVEPPDPGLEIEGVVPDIEVIPPWELLPIPAAPAIPSEVSGIIRSRWVPLDWLKQQQSFRKRLAAAGPDAFVRRVEPVGQPPVSDDGPAGVSVSSIAGGSSASSARMQEFVKLVEVWTTRQGRTLSRYIACVDDVVLVNLDFSQSADPPLMPVHVARYCDTGGFYGRGLVELLLPVCVEQEAMLQNLFRNASEIDAFGMVFLPQTLGINVNSLKKRPPTGEPRIATFEIDYTVPEARPMNIAPANTGTLPGEIMKLSIGLFDRIAPQSELLSGGAPGRVDSARALGLLYETSTVPLASPAASIAIALSGVYSAVLDVVRRLWPAPRIAAMATVDDALAGVVLDPRTGTLDPQRNAVPRPEEVDVGIVSRMPQSPEQMKLELDNALKMGLITPRWYRIEARKRGLGLPLANDSEWYNYQKAVYNNILVFGDGETPGTALVSENDLHEIHVEVILAFMSRPEFSLASAKVRKAFEDLLDIHRTLLGKWPEQLPPVENLAESNEEMQARVEKAAAALGAPPPEARGGVNPFLPPAVP